MKKKLLIVLVGAMLTAFAFAGDAFKYKLVFDDVSMEVAAWAFGRLEGANDASDDLDNPVPPGNPGDENGMNYISFRGQWNIDDAQYISDSPDNPLAPNPMLVLSEDYRSPDSVATTWTMDVRVSSAKTLKWEAEAGKALSSSGSILELVLPNGTTVDMKSQNSISSLVSGTYLIKYKANASVVDAPVVPELIDKEIVVYEGGSISIKLFDPNEYELAENNQYEITFFKVDGAKYTIVEGPTSEGLSYDAATGSIIYTFNTAINYDAVVILYRFRKKSDTRADNTSVTVGSVRAVVVKKPLLEMVSAPEQTVDIKSTEPLADMCTLEYSLAFPDSEPDGRTISEENPLIIYATLTEPPSFTSDAEGMEEDSRSPNANGGDDVTYKYNATSNGFTLRFTLKALEKAKKSTVSLRVSCKFPNDSTNVALPEDIATTTATITVKGAGNLSVDGDEYINYVDAYLIGYFIDQLANVPDIYETAEDIPSEDILGHLAGEYSAEKAQEIKDNLIALADGGMLDITGDGFTNYIDQYLIGYFIDQLANVPDIYETAADIPIEDILGHLAGEFTPEQGEQIKQRLLDLVP